MAILGSPVDVAQYEQVAQPSSRRGRLVTYLSVMLGFVVMLEFYQMHDSLVRTRMKLAELTGDALKEKNFMCLPKTPTYSPCVCKAKKAPHAQCVETTDEPTLSWWCQDSLFEKNCDETAIFKELGKPQAPITAVAETAAPEQKLRAPKASCGSEDMTGDGSDYKGCQTRTVSGRECVAWEPSAVDGFQQKRSCVGCGNYCRNVGNRATIWCYTSDPSQRWDYCVPLNTAIPAPQEPMFNMFLDVEPLATCKPASGQTLKQILAERAPALQLTSVPPKQPELFTCPSIKEGSQYHADSYWDFADRNYCMSSEGMWRVDVRASKKARWAAVSEWLGLASGPNVVFDWGMGCGHEIDWLKRQNPELTVLGNDRFPRNIQYAQQHTKVDRVCAGDGRDLSHLADESIDVFTSHASLSELEPETHCHVIRQAVRLLRPGGCAWSTPGHNIDWMPVDWNRCLQGLEGIDWTVIKDKEAYGEGCGQEDSWAPVGESLFLCKAQVGHV